MFFRKQIESIEADVVQIERDIGDTARIIKGQAIGLRLEKIKNKMSELKEGCNE